MKKCIYGLAVLGLVLSTAGLAGADVSGVTAGINPTTVNTASRYTIGFTTGASGALAIGDTITITFPTNTNVPAVISAGAQITVNTVNVTSASLGSGQSLVITSPVAVGASTPVAVVINTGTASIVNPSIPGTYSLQVATSIETTAVTSGTYSTTVSSETVNVGTVVTTPATIGNPADYSIAFDTGAAGALLGGTSQITVVFPAGTFVPGGSLSGISISGTGAASAIGSGGNTLTLVPTQNIGSSTGVTISFPASTGIRNPTTTGSKQLSISTSSQTNAGLSDLYTISTYATAVTGITASPAPSVVGNYAQYTIGLTTDATNGYLVGGTSQIIITFPTGTTVTAGSLTASVQVNGVGASSATGNSTARTITIVPAQNIVGGSVISVVISTAGNAVRNPTTSGNYTLQVRTSPQPTNGTSGSYALAFSTQPVTGITVTPAPAIIGNRSQYTVAFTTDAAEGFLVGGTSTITITFPSGTAVYGGAIAGVTVNGTAATSATGNGTARTVTIVPSLNVAGGSVTVVIPRADNGVRNPLSIGSYTLQVHTSPQNMDATSPAYNITTLATAVSITNVTPVPMLTDVFAQYTVIFGIDSSGDLVGASSQIIIAFPAGTTVTAGSIAGVTVNGTVATSTTGNSASRTLTIVPAQNLNGGSALIVVVPSAGVVRNPDTTGSYTLQVRTSPQPNNGTSSSYGIADPTPTPTYTRTCTPTATPTITLTSTITPTITITCTPYPTVTLTSTMTITPYQIPTTEVVTYPSPATGDVVWFYFWARASAKLKIEFFNVMGEHCGQVEETIADTGFNRVSWTIKGMAPGIYLYRMTVENPGGEIQKYGLRKIMVVKKK